jgi:hypothetical protein
MRALLASARIALWKSIASARSFCTRHILPYTDTAPGKLVVEGPEEDVKSTSDPVLEEAT